jgi:endonuclease/exonuclease/phosphatase (EEP) superfamily protein YafD
VLLAPLGLVVRKVRYWGAVLLAVALLLLEYGAPLTARAVGVDEGADPIAVFSFNVWGYSDSADTVLEIVSRGTPDVVLLQELSPSLAPVLVEELGALYPYRLLEPDEGPRGGGILSRYPLRPASLTEGSPVSQFAQVVEVELGERAFTLYNVHLSATSALYYLESGGPVARQVRGSFEARERQVSQLIEDLGHRQGPVVVAGDFNMTGQSEAYRALARHLQDAHRQVGRGFGHTFPAYEGRYRGIPILPRMVRIDMVLYTSEWTALECQVLREHGQSDHLPILARLALAQSAPPLSPP